MQYSVTECSIEQRGEKVSVLYLLLRELPLGRVLYCTVILSITVGGVGVGVGVCDTVVQLFEAC